MSSKITQEFVLGVTGPTQEAVGIHTIILLANK